MGFNEAYLGAPPWDIGRPQHEFVVLGEAGEVIGDVIDVGCGTGEHTMYFACLGHDSLGVDSAPRAIEKAKAKERLRRSGARFEVHDALRLDSLGRSFDTAVDSGLFHVFDDPGRPIYVRSLASVVRKGGRCFVLCFSKKQPPGWGPRRVSEKELRGAFASGWRVDYVREASFETNQRGVEARALLAKMTRL